MNIAYECAGKYKCRECIIAVMHAQQNHQVLHSMKYFFDCYVHNFKESNLFEY